jgi:Uncharacterized conserved protein
MVVYAGLPPSIPEWQTERDKKNKFLHWLRSNAFLVVAKDGSPGDGKHYKANVDVLMAIDAVELSVEMRPDLVVLVTGDADFAHLALQLRRRGIRVEVAATAPTLGTGLKGAANEIIVGKVRGGERQAAFGSAKKDLAQDYDVAITCAGSGATKHICPTLVPKQPKTKSRSAPISSGSRKANR